MTKVRHEITAESSRKKKITKTGPKLTCQVNSQGPKSGAEGFQCFQSFKKSRINVGEKMYIFHQLTDRIWRFGFLFFFLKGHFKNHER